MPLLLALLAQIGAQATPAPATASSRNPLFAGADPDIVALCGRWWLYPTDPGTGQPGSGARRFYAWSSPDLRHWTRSAPLLAMADVPWITADGAPDHGLWAPSLTAADGRYYLYYAVGPQDPTPSRLGVAVGTSPAGPFRDSGRPLLTGGDGFEAIDPMVFVDAASRKRYLYAGGSAGATLRIYELKPDLTEIAREIPVETPPFFTEGAFMHERRGVYYLSYSHGHWNGPDYSVHYATGPTPVGPWRYRGVILSADARHQGPGHHSFAENPRTHQWVIAYHRWQRPPGLGPYAGTREIAIDPIRYRKDGTIIPVRETDSPPPLSPLPARRCTGETP